MKIELEFQDGVLDDLMTGAGKDASTPLVLLAWVPKRVSQAATRITLTPDGQEPQVVKDRFGPEFEDRGLLTREEHEAMALSGKLAGKLFAIIAHAPPSTKDKNVANHDWSEMAAEIHRIQHFIMAQAAARAYPNHYRLSGATIPGAEGCGNVSG